MTLLDKLAGAAADGIFIQDVPPKGRGVFARRRFGPGEVVVIGKPVAGAPERTTTSFQVAHDRHVELDEPARVINHSCQPNTGVRDNAFGGYDFVARTTIEAGAEITWDYETTEYVSIAVPACHCGAPRCRGTLRGFRFLPAETRALLAEEFIADYLKRR